MLCFEVCSFRRGREWSPYRRKADFPCFAHSGRQVGPSHALPAGGTADLRGPAGAPDEGRAAGEWKSQEKGKPRGRLMLMAKSGFTS